MNKMTQDKIKYRQLTPGFSLFQGSPSSIGNKNKIS